MYEVNLSAPTIFSWQQQRTNRIVYPAVFLFWALGFLFNAISTKDWWQNKILYTLNGKFLLWSFMISALSMAFAVPCGCLPVMKSKARR